MAYRYRNSKGVEYYLHAKQMPSKKGGARTLYFFAREEKAGGLDQVPAGFKVVETPNGLPVLKKTESMAAPA
jgi:hypothetical protein